MDIAFFMYLQTDYVYVFCITILLPFNVVAILALELVVASSKPILSCRDEVKRLAEEHTCDLIPEENVAEEYI